MIRATVETLAAMAFITLVLAYGIHWADVEPEPPAKATQDALL